MNEGNFIEFALPCNKRCPTFIYQICSFGVFFCTRNICVSRRIDYQSNVFVLSDIVFQRFIIDIYRILDVSGSNSLDRLHSLQTRSIGQSWPLAPNNRIFILFSVALSCERRVKFENSGHFWSRSDTMMDLFTPIPNRCLKFCHSKNATFWLWRIGRVNFIENQCIIFRGYISMSKTFGDK